MEKNDQPINQFINYTMKTGKDDEVIRVYDVEQINKAQHKGGSIWDVYIARIMKYHESHAIMPDLGDYIGFEIKPGVTKYLVEHPEAQKSLLGWLAYYYNLEKGPEIKHNKDKYFLGQMSQGDEGQYIPNLKSQTVEDYFNQYVDKLIKKEEKEFEQDER